MRVTQDELEECAFRLLKDLQGLFSVLGDCREFRQMESRIVQAVSMRRPVIDELEGLNNELYELFERTHPVGPTG